MLDLVARTYFAPRLLDEESLKGGTNHPRNTVRRVWNGRPAVGYVEVCGAVLTVRIHPFVRNGHLIYCQGER